MYIKEDAKKIEYALDIFKGTCLLNNYEAILGGKDIKDTLSSLKEDGKYFYYSLCPEVELGGVIKGKINSYEKCEFVNLAVKILNNMGIYDFIVKVDSKDSSIVENLESIDIGVDSKASSSETFEIYIDDKPVVIGKLEDEKNYFKMKFDDIKDYIRVDETDELDLYVLPKDKESMSDALVISTNLKDAGFKVAVDYSLQKVDEDKLNSAFLITFDANDIRKYKVHYKDLKTKEEKEVLIDNIIEELSFF